MENNRFDEAVWVYAGLNIPRPLETAAQALMFLDDCPSALRGADHAAAFAACRAALNRELDVQDAREALVAFADRRGILAPDMTPVIAARATMPADMRLSA